MNKVSYRILERHRVEGVLYLIIEYYGKRYVVEEEKFHVSLALQCISAK